MKTTIRLLAAIATIAATLPAYAEGSLGDWFDSAWNNVTRSYDEGTGELLIPTYTWHLPFAYTDEKINGYQNYPYGLGYGRGRFDEKGNYHGVFAMGFQDSHFLPEWMVGYSWKTYWPLGEELKGGLGFVTGLTARSDYGHYTPVPFILPAASIEYGRWSLDAAYVPGGKGNGNVIFFVNKWRFGANP
ncbi:MAG: lipid IV(A) palmitoyltransferase PagP [Gammaproteobacteria bacterium]|nr:lipid IV(A) palmitoyltransferase PagP [Gammaproteobacteria bacterium]MBU1415130.1 lipid IV(A) palmitoyltransferase PagP [Gammaproteobacteria bacterium]